MYCCMPLSLFFSCLINELTDWGLLDLESCARGVHCRCRSHGAHHLFSNLPPLHHTVRWYYYFFPGLSKMSSPRNCFFPLARGLWAQFWWLLLHACFQLDLCWQFCPPTECLICFRWSSNQVRHRQYCPFTSWLSTRLVSKVRRLLSPDLSVHPVFNARLGPFWCELCALFL